MMSTRLVASESRAHSAPCLKDRCWMVPLLAACLSCLYALPQTNVGVFYVLFMGKFGINHEAASWAKTISSVTSYLMGFAIGALQKKVSTHSLMLSGAVLCPVAFITSAFVPNMHWMCVTSGFIHGCGLGLIMISTSIYIVSYFEKYRSFATGIQYLGISLSGIIGPSVLSKIAATYGLEGTMLLAGGVTLNLLPLTLLLRNPRPVELRCCRRWKKNGDVKATAAGACVEHVDETLLHGAADPHNGSIELEVDDNKDVMRITTTAAQDSRHGQQGHCTQVSYAPEDRKDKFGVISQVLHVLRMPTFYVILVPVVAADITLPMLAFTIVDYAIDKGVPLDFAATLVSCQCAGGFCGRLVIPLISDRTPRGRCVIGSCSFVLISLCFLLMPHVANFAAVAAVVFFAGAQQGYLATIKTVLVADYLGVQNVAVCWGIMGLLSMPLTFCEPYIIGAFRDRQGSYDNLYRLCGTVDFVAAFLLGVQIILD
ncbi:monocarboxylate transporter 14-like [Dermacentor variabilis]|uniref:monocarboxylate transporter 14-like n=1 Tax=Dermacentor variabilis TaxID=34621 RepID=UPI003F5B80E0